MNKEATEQKPIEIKYSKQIPSIYETLRNQFGVEWSRGLVITYGDTIYCAYDLPEDLKIHEGTHVYQQEAIGKEKWWEQYLSDVKFRLEQETAAYMNQAKYLRANLNRHYRRQAFDRLSNDMVRMYGGMCTKEQALEILNKA